MAADVPHGARRDRCRSCGAEVWWVVTANNKAMPLDPGPRSDGNMVFVDGGVVHFDPGDLFHAQLARFVSHFVTCPQANSWRRPR